MKNKSKFGTKWWFERALLPLFLVLYLVAILLNSLKLRPVADDFCFASAAKGGFFESIWDWYYTWVGDITVTTLNTLLVGVPTSVSVRFSFIPFIAGCISIAWVGSLLFIPRRRFQCRVSIIAFLFLSWSTFLWFPALASQAVYGQGLVTTIAEQSTFWGVVNSSYVIPVTVVISMYLICDHTISQNKGYPKFLLFLAPVGGLILGLSGYVLAVSTATAITLQLLKVRLIPNAIAFRQHFIHYCFFIITILMGILTSLLAPGVTIRRESLPKQTLLEVGSRIPKELFVSFLTVFQLLGSLSFALAIISGFIIFNFLAQGKVLIWKNYTVELLSFLIVIVFVNRMSELFSYSAISHLQMAVVIQFLLGLSIGIQIGRRHSDNFPLRIVKSNRVIACLIWVLCSSGALLYFWFSTSKFLDLWNMRAGYHSLPGFAEGWIYECAKKIIG